MLRARKLNWRGNRLGSPGRSPRALPGVFYYAAMAALTEEHGRDRKSLGPVVNIEEVACNLRLVVVHYGRMRPQAVVPLCAQTLTDSGSVWEGFRARVFSPRSPQR